MRWTRVIGAVAAGGAAALALALPGARGAPGPERRPGRVVRIERPRLRPATPIRFCIIMSPGEAEMVCYGRAPPAQGSRFAVVDDSGMRGHVIARESARAPGHDGCELGTAHAVTLEVVDAELGSSSYFWQVAVQGVAIEPDGRLLPPEPQVRSPSGRDGEQVWARLDRDGDGEADVLGTAHDCTGEVRDLPPAPSGQRVVPLCLDTWLRDQLEWTMVGRDVFLQCH